MKVHTKVEMDQKKIQRLIEASKKSLELTAEFILSDIVSSAVVPKDTGELERSGFVDISKGDVYKIIFDTPYARRLYWHPEFNFRTDKNVNARGKWMMAYTDGDKKDFVIETYMSFLKELSGGIVK